MASNGDTNIMLHPKPCEVLLDEERIFSFSVIMIHPWQMRRGLEIFA
jgi:hypothetical protein